MGLHIKDILKLMEVFIEARDLLEKQHKINKRIEFTLKRMNTIIGESYHEKKEDNI